MNLPPIKNAYCNAHARRYFKDSEEKFPEESKYFIEIYRKIYHLESLAKTSDPPDILAHRDMTVFGVGWVRQPFVGHQQTPPHPERQAGA